MSACLSVCLLSLLIATCKAQSDDRHLICKQVGSDFSHQTSAVQTNGNVLRGPPGLRGKAGPRGLKGEKGGMGVGGQRGEKGERGDVDWVRINATIQAAMKDLMERLEKKADIEDLMGRLKQKAVNADGQCKGVFLEKCFRVFWPKTKYSDARLQCENIGFKGADIENKKQYDAIVAYVRTNGTAAIDHLVLGMTIDPETKIVRYSNGTVGGYTEWYTGWPSDNLLRTGVGLRVSQNPTPSDNGMFNVIRQFPTDGILCMQ